MVRICLHVVSPRARGKIILATGNQNFSTGMLTASGLSTYEDLVSTNTKAPKTKLRNALMHIKVNESF